MLEVVRTAPPERALREVLHEALPLDAARLQEWRVWLAFRAQASVDPELRREQHRRYKEWTDLLQRLIGPAGLAADVDAVIALIDGLGSRAALDPEAMATNHQLAILDRLPRYRPGRAVTPGDLDHSVRRSVRIREVDN